jgi:predicted RNA-binding protein YlxR (DUF448 family)
MKPKKVPLRTCLGCKTVKPKKELIRIVRTPNGEVIVDQTGKKSGRGAYICPNTGCLEHTLKGSFLGSALEIDLSEATKNTLREALLQIIP